MNQPVIESNPAVMMGKPVIAGTRITVESILEKLAHGESMEQILDAHPRLKVHRRRRAPWQAGENREIDMPSWPLVMRAAKPPARTTQDAGIGRPGTGQRHLGNNSHREKYAFGGMNSGDNYSDAGGAQFSTFRPSTRRKCFSLLVTSTAPALRAWAAIMRSMLPIGTPADSSFARMSA